MLKLEVYSPSINSVVSNTKLPELVGVSDSASNVGVVSDTSMISDHGYATATNSDLSNNLTTTPLIDASVQTNAPSTWDTVKQLFLDVCSVN